MNKKDGFLQRAGDFLSGKGFYIVLFLCVAVIGASAWAMLSLGNNEEINSEVAEVSSDASPSNPSNTMETSDEVDGQAGEEDWTVMAESETEVLDEEETLEEAEENEQEEAEESPESEEEAAVEQSPEAEESTEPQEETAAISGYIWPVSGEVIVQHSTSELMYDKTMGDWRTHSGIDISADLGSKVLAICSGTVESIVEDGLYGTTVTIDHGNELKSVYSNLASTPTVAEGDTVSAGNTIGAVGDTAIAESGIETHLHLEIIDSGVKVDPLDYLS